MDNILQNESTDQLTSAEDVKKRKKVLERFFQMSAVMIGLSVCSIVLGTLLIVYKAEEDQGALILTTNTGSPIWSGALLLLNGIWCQVVSNTEAGYKSKMTIQRRINRISFVTNIISLIICTFPFISSFFCAIIFRNGDHACKNVAASRGRKLNILALITSAIMIISNIVGFVLFRLKRKTSNSDRDENSSFNQRPCWINLLQQNYSGLDGRHSYELPEYRMRDLDFASLPSGLREAMDHSSTEHTDPPPAYM